MVDAKKLRTIAVYGGLWTVLLGFLFPPVRAQSVIPIRQIRLDKACGPRCLMALIEITGVGRQDCDLKCIYDLIGKKPLSPTNLKDLKDAAEQLGFSAAGHKLNIARLRKMKGYAILAVGNVLGTRRTPFHFILIKRVTAEHAIMIDPRTLQSKALVLSDLEKIWTGYALVISSRDAKRPLPEPPDDPNLPRPRPRTASGPVQEEWNFGVADQGATLEHTFIIHRANEGPREVRSLDKSCTCLEARLGEDTAGNTTLTVKLTAKKAAWQSAEARVVFEPSGKIERYAVKAFGKSAFRVNPSEGYIEVAADGTTEYPVQITYYVDANDFVAFNRFKSGLSEIETGVVKSRRVFPDPDLPQTVAYIFDVPLICHGQTRADQMGARMTTGAVSFVFDTNKGEREVNLDLIVKVGSDLVRVFPEKLFLMASKAGAPAQRKVKLEFLEKPYPTDVAVCVDEAFPADVSCTRVTENEFIARVVIPFKKLVNCPLGKQSGTIKFIPEGGQDPIEVPVSVLVRE